MALFLSIDDTDVPGSRGTGRLARGIAERLSSDFTVTGVTRHQLYIHPDIPYTSHNSCAVIHVDADSGGAIDEIFGIGRDMVRDDFIEGSDPGIAVATSGQVTPAVIAFGLDAKETVLSQEKARTLAGNSGIRLEGLGGTEGGVIGAMAGLGLAATGCDGRFLSCGRVRDLTGPREVRDLLEAGVDEVFSLDGRIIREGVISVEEGKSVKPCPANGRVILFVESRDGGLYAVKRN